MTSICQVITVIVLIASKVSALHCQLLINGNGVNGPSSSGSLYEPVYESVSYAAIVMKTTTTPWPPPKLFTRKTSTTLQGITAQSCPHRCVCSFNKRNQFQVICHENFYDDFPIKELRSDVEILIIDPQEKSRNRLSLGPFFRGLRILKELIIKKSQIPSIGRRTLWGLSGLKVLNLDGNNITSVIDQNFEGLYSLRQLSLEDNQIRSLVSAAFHYIPLLESLSLKNNKIEALAPRIFYKLRHLKVLDLSGNSIKHIDGKIFIDIPNLDTFKCSGCGLNELHISNGHYLHKLRTLDLSHNNYKDFQHINSAFMRDIRKIDLSWNELTSIRKPFESTIFQHLLVSHNNITTINDCVFCNTSLQTLDLSDNIGLIELNSKMFEEGFRSLLSISLSGIWLNPENIQNLLKKVPNLEALDISRTGMVSLPDSFLQSNNKIKSANFSGNYLISLDFETMFRDSKYLEVLDISHNNFISLSQGFFDEIKRKKHIKWVYLQNNQWRCDKCHIKPLLHWLHNSLMYWGSCFHKQNDLCIKCFEPNHLLHVPIENLVEGELDECGTQYDVPDHNSFNRKSESSSTSSTDFNSYTLLTVAIIMTSVVLALIVIFSSRFRHYGVYLTREELLFDGENAIRNPVIVLDKNSESYINLKYPTNVE